MNSYAYDSITKRIVTLLEQGTRPLAQTLECKNRVAPEFRDEKTVSRDQRVSSHVYDV